MNKKQITFWARKCDVTGQGMNEGYVWGDGQFYCINDDSVALLEFRKDRKHIISYIPKDVTDIDFFDNWLEEDDEEYLSAIDRVKENKDTDEDLRSLSYLFDLHYWTEWECKDDIQYVEIDGVMYEEGEEEFNMAIEMDKVAPN